MRTWPWLPTVPWIDRDPADEMVLGLVVPGRVEAIIRGDNDLLVLKHFGNARIVTPRELWESTRAERG